MLVYQRVNHGKPVPDPPEEPNVYGVLGKP